MKLARILAATLALCAFSAQAQLILEQATATQTRLVGPFVDSTDGVTPETGLTIDAADVRISINGGNIVGKNSGGCTHDELGMYACTFDATDTATVGSMQVIVVEAGAVPVYHEFQIVEEAVHADLYDAGAPGPAVAADLSTLATSAALATVDSNVDAILVDTGTTLDAALAVVDANVDAILVDTSTTLDDYLDTEIAAILADTNELQTDWADGGRLDNLLDSASSAGDPWSTALPGAYGAGTAGLLLGTTIPNAIDAIDNYVDTEVADILADTNELQTDDYPTTLATLATSAALATVDSNVDAILVDTGTTLDAALAVVDANVDAILVDTSTTLDDYLDTEIAAILADTNELQTDDYPARFTGIEGATFSTGTDSLEAIRNRGDAAWVTGGGGSLELGVQETTVSTAPSTTTITVAAPPDFDDQVNGWAIYLEDNGDAGSYWVTPITDYVQSTGVITYRDAAPFTVAASDIAVFLPAFLADGVDVTTIEGTDATDQLDAHAAAGLDAAGVRSAVGLASANLDTQLSAIDNYVDTEVAAIVSAIGTPSDLGSGATVAANLVDVEGQTDDIGVAGAGLTAADDATIAAIGALNDLDGAAVNAEVDAAIETYHLDHLLAADYDPASPPGTSTALLNELVESDVGVSRFTSNALEQAPTSGGGNMTQIEGVDATDQIDARIDARLAAYDPPTDTEMDAQFAALENLSQAQAQAAAQSALQVELEQLSARDTLDYNCEVSNAVTTPTTTLVPCIVTDRDDMAVTTASGDLDGKRIRFLNGDQVSEERFIQSTVLNTGELRLTIAPALPGAPADGDTAQIY